MVSLLDVIRERAVLHAPPGQPFTLKSGATSMTYVDVRLASLSHEGMRLLASTLSKKVIRMGIEADLVAGVALGGCPLATGVSMRSEVDCLYVRTSAKSHGTGKLLEGAFKPGDRVVIFEDVITSGGSTLAAINVLREADLVVTGVVAVLDREQGGLDRIRAECPAEALFTLSELVGGDSVQA